YQELAGTAETKLLSNDNSKYVVNTIRFGSKGGSVEVFSLINLYRKFHNENDYLHNGYNHKIFSTEPQNVSNQPSKLPFLNITDDKGHFLFSVVPPQVEKLTNSNIPSNTLFLLAISIFLLGIYIAQWIANLIKIHQFGRAFALLSAYLIFIRLMMLSNSIPFIVYESNLFNPKFLTINALAPSLGDMLLNAVVIFLLVGYLVTYFYRSNTYYKLFNTPKVLQYIISIGLVTTSITITSLFFRNLCNVYEKSQFTLDLALSISFSSLKIAALLFYVILSIIFFLLNHLLCSLFLRLNKDFKMAIIMWMIGVLIGLLVISIIDQFRWVYLIVGLYFLLVYANKFPRFFYNFKYKTTIYFFTGAFVFAFIAMFVIFHEEQKKDFYDKLKFGQKYLAENDVLGEGLLARVVQTVQTDTAISEALNRATLAREQTQQIVKSRHLDLYFDRYDTDVLAFDKNGKSLDLSEGANNLAYYEGNFHKPEYKTSNPNIFFIDDIGNNFIKQYVAFIPVSRNGTLIGNVVLELKLRDEFAESVYPELLMDKKFAQTPETRNYSYAIYNEKNQLIFNSGNYNYMRKLPVSVLNSKEIYEKGVELNDYNHIGKIGQNGRKIVISSKYQIWQSVFPNFSFLFLLSVLCIVFVMLLYTLKYSFRNMNVNFSTKIQLYLNAAFLVPLVLVVIITLSVINSTFVSNQEKAYLDNTKNITSTVQLQLENFTQKRMSRAFLEQEINDLAHDTKLDINLYNLDGKLNLTTRPLVYEYGLISSFINPIAY
ncbi:MAG TPA: two-component sensor histidine kinase, partial [Emticicia sp.]